MRRWISLFLALSLLVTMLVLPVSAAETEPVEVTLKAFSNLLGITSVDGLYRDNTFYVSAQTICDFTGGTYEEELAGERIMFLFNHRMREIHADISGVAAEHIGEDRYEFKLPAISHDGALYVSMVHLLRYLGCTVQFAENEKAEVHVAVHCPYTVQDLMADFLACEDRSFSWSEVDGMFVDSSLGIVLAGLDTLLLGYDADLYKYILSMVCPDFVDVSEAVYQDAIHQILCNEGYSHLSDENVEMQIIHAQMETLGMGLDIDGFLSDTIINNTSVGDIMKGSAYVVKGIYTGMGIVVPPLSDWLKNMETTYHYIRLSENQRVLLEDTMCHYQKGSELYEKDPSLFKAGQTIQNIIGDEQERREEVREETVRSFLYNATGTTVSGLLSALDPTVFSPLELVTMGYDAAIYLLKSLPDVQEIVERETKVTMAVVDLKIQQIARIRIEECARQWQQNLMYLGSSDTTHQRQMRSAMILNLKAALTARENLIASEFVTEESAALMEQKAKQTAILLYKAETSVEVPIGIAPKVEEDISWIRLLVKPMVIVTVQVKEEQGQSYHLVTSVPEVYMPGREEVARVVNQTVTEELIALFQGRNENSLKYIGTTPGLKEFFSSVLSLDTAYASENFLSLGVRYHWKSEWSLGTSRGDRSFTELEYRVIDLRTGARLRVADLLDPENPSAKTELADRFAQALTDVKNSRGLRENLYEKKHAQEFVNGEWEDVWYLSEYGLEFTFSQGKIASNAVDCVEGRIAYRDLEGILDDAFLPEERTGGGTCEVRDADGTEMNRIYGMQTGKALFAEGENTDVTVRSEAYEGILFYASRISDAMAWVPKAEQYTIHHR